MRMKLWPSKQESHGVKATRRLLYYGLGLLLGFVLVVGVVIGMVYIVQDYRTRRLLAEEIEFIRSRHAPLTTIELNERYQADATNDSFTTEFIAALAIADDRRWGEMGATLPIVGDGEYPNDFEVEWPQLSAVEAYLAQQQDLLRFVEAIDPQRDKVRIPVDRTMGIFARTPHVQQLRFAARSLHLQFLVDAHHGRIDEAVNQIQQQIALAEMLRDEPSMVSHVVRCTLYFAVLNQLEVLLRNFELSDVHLAKLQSLLQQTDFLYGLGKALEGETAILYTASTWPIMVLAEDPGTPPITRDEVIRLANQPPSMPADVALMLSYFRRLQVACEKSLPAALGENEVIRQEIDLIQSSPEKLLHVKTLLLFPPIQTMMVSFGRAEARCRSAQIALAAIRHRHTADNWPETAESLVPAYLASIPVDPFSSAPLLIKVSPEEYKVYSVGANRIDDGGIWNIRDFKDSGFTATWRKKPPQREPGSHLGSVEMTTVLGEHFRQNLAMHVGQAEVAALEAEGEPLVVDAK
jgi:hypothetical protein